MKKIDDSLVTGYDLEWIWDNTYIMYIFLFLYMKVSITATGRSEDGIPSRPMAVIFSFTSMETFMHGHAML